jgi:hypothetical protein
MGEIEGKQWNDCRAGLLSKRFKLPVFMIMIHDMRNSTVQQSASSEDTTSNTDLINRRPVLECPERGVGEGLHG